MSGVILTGPHAQVFEPRRLSVAELQAYIRRGCECCVCEFARAEILEREKEARENKA